MTRKEALKTLLTKPDVLADLVNDDAVRVKIEAIVDRRKKASENDRMMCANCPENPDKTGSMGACWDKAGACATPSVGYGGPFC